MGPFLRYSLLRLAVLAVVGGLFWLVGLRGLLWALASVAVAAGVSYLTLAGAREDVLSRWDAGRAASRGERGRAPSDEEVEDARTDATDPDPGQRG